MEDSSHIIDALITAQEKERSDIAYELHGNIAQVLVSALLYLGLTKTAVKSDSPFFEETELLITDAIREVKSLSNFLSPPYLNDTALVESFENIKKMVDSHITMHINTDDFNEHGIPDKLKLNIYRIVEEWCRHHCKKPGLTNIHLLLSGNSEKLLLSIKDDGIVSNDPAHTNPILLTGISARTSLFNGQTKFAAEPGKGTELTISFGN